MAESDNIDDLIRNSVFLDINGNIIENPFTGEILPDNQEITEEIPTDDIEIVPSPPGVQQYVLDDSGNTAAWRPATLEGLIEMQQRLGINPIPSSAIHHGIGIYQALQDLQALEAYTANFNGISTNIEIEPIDTKEEASTPIEEYVELSRSHIIDKMKELFNNKFGEDRVDFRQDSNPSYYTFMVHYPEINITNSTGRKHVIRDLYVRFNYRINESHRDITVILGEENAARLSVTKDEYTADYGFSHLSGGITSWGSFCMGYGTPMNKKSNELASGTVIKSVEDLNEFLDNLYIYLLMFDSYLEWESITGVPYRHLNSIGTANRFGSGLNNYSISNSNTNIGRAITTVLFNQDKELVEELFDKCIINTGDGVKINLYQLAMLIDSLFDDSKKRSNSIPFVRYDELTYSANFNSFQMEEHASPDGTLKNGVKIKFKGENLKARLIDISETDFDSKEQSYIIHPAIVAQVAIEIKQIFEKLRDNI